MSACEGLDSLNETSQPLTNLGVELTPSTFITTLTSIGGLKTRKVPYKKKSVLRESHTKKLSRMVLLGKALSKLLYSKRNIDLFKNMTKGRLSQH